MELTFISQSPHETIGCGKLLGSIVQPGSIIGLVGELGAGKTCFIKGLASALTGVAEDDVTSPTFTLLQEFPAAIPLYHFDLYRIAALDDLRDLGFEECVYGAGVTVIEWADRAEAALPPECLTIHISVIDENRRAFIFKARGEKHTEIIKKLKQKTGGGTYEWH